MAMMSIFEVLGSVCIALTTLPMPSDDALEYAGPMIGNHLTCQIQGYILTFGLAGGGSLYMCLSWYFVCKMTIKMNCYTISKRIEPLFYVYSFGLALFLPSYNLSKDLINTFQSHQFCAIGLNHSNCTYLLSEDIFECDNRIIDSANNELLETLDVVMYLIGFNIAMIVLAMMIIIWTIKKNNNSIKCALEDQKKRNIPNDDESVISELRYARVLVIQALMYIFTYLITWIFMVIPMAVYLDRDTLNIIQVFKSIFFPMQGFWNLIIFIYDKAYLLHHDNEYQGFGKVVKIVLFHPAKAPEIILPDSLTIDVQNCNAQSIMIGTFDHNGERIREVDQLTSLQSLGCDHMRKDFAHSMESDNPSASSSNQVIYRDGIEFLGEENRRFYLDSNGLLRTGKVEDRRKGRVEFQASASIESPGGFVSDSNSSYLK